MLSYQISSLKRLLSYDKSHEFKIIFQIKYSKETNDDAVIQKEKRIIFTTTINQARVLSKVIDDKYRNDPTIKEHVFIINEMKQVKSADIIDVISRMVNGEENQMISDDKMYLYNRMIAIFDDENDSPDCHSIIIECEYVDNNKLCGIITYIREKANGSVNEIKLMGGSQHYPNYPIDNLLLFDEANASQGYMCIGVSRQHAWIEWDFGNRKISMTSYSIQALYKIKDRFQPKTWKFMGSNDHEKWELIDYKGNVDEMNGGDFSGHFECMKKGEFYRYIKYIQIDGCLSWLAYKHNRYIIAISSIEFFGSISLDNV